MIQNVGGNSSDFYNLVKSKTKTRSALPPMLIKGGIRYFGVDRFDVLATHLKASFTTSSTNFSNQHGECYNQLEKIYDENITKDYTQLWQNYQENFNIEDVANIVLNLNERKDPGPMCISAKFIKFNANKLIPILHQYLCRVLEHGIIPKNWKNSFIIPIPKKGAKNDVNNYRGIAIQSIIPKIFDKLLTTKLIQHMSEIIPQTQHGFMSAKSTQSNLVEITQFISEKAAQGHQVDVIYFDFSKAFDVIDHHILASKLAMYSIPFTLFFTTMNFIIGRTYRLKIDGKLTDHQFQTQSSVPQGSHCGPFLFNIMSSDITNCTKDTPNFQLMYADDVKFYATINNLEDQLTLQRSIDKLHNWSIQNKIKLNSAKTYVVSYTMKKRTYINSRYYLSNEIITKVKEMRDLGVLFDDKLTFDNHIAMLANKASRITAMAYKFAKEISMPSINMKIIQTYLVPILEYASVVWYPTKTRNIKALEKSLQYATRAQLKSPYRNDHPEYKSYPDRLAELNLLSMEERRNVQLIKFTSKLCRNEIKSTIGRTLSTYINVNARNRNPNIFKYSSSLPSSPLKMMMSCTNKFSHLIHLNEDSPSTVGKKATKHYLQLRNHQR